MFNWILRVLNTEARKESELVTAALNGEPLTLIEHFEKQTKPFKQISSRDYISASGRITVCDDIYGYEIKIDNGLLLDCSPSYYGFREETAMRLYNAIVSCLKMKRELV
jgi:hypothetical protein